MFLLYYRDFFEQICSDVQFISPPEEVGEFLLHLLKSNGSRPSMAIENLKVSSSETISTDSSLNICFRRLLKFSNHTEMVCALSIF